ncbi:protein of unknown function [uncultured Sphingopyxis sp.]|uniref:Uncharacterized protein n=1 Tax=uncultured Sphingopyxis sp. TaxID=310581 RepID=A0A1Y5PUH7_9SPHN|nr:protein of unknown function [uncultured Sphingopyxis sp.]
MGAISLAQGRWPPPAATKPASWQVSLPSPEGEGLIWINVHFPPQSGQLRGAGSIFFPFGPARATVRV